MNKIVLVLMLSALSLCAMNWHSYEEALVIQKKNSKPIMIDAMRDNCHYCADMEEGVFQDKKMAKWIEERFIPVKINLDENQMPLGIKVIVTPTFYFINHEQKVLKKIPGAWNSEDFQSLTKDLK